ncbi:MAG: delta-lactam-biosynthetic de-N-acetylase [Clostridia bacterium]|nr:delta-lactam-biosynthetic de-N-acetylase [Clostridia bacterium]
MSLKKIMVCFIVLCLLTVSSGCGKKTDYSSLSDLGGVYQSSSKDLDFSVEVTGSLSEGAEYASAGRPQEEYVETLAEGQFSNKVLRWGIARKSEHQTPDADPGAPQLLEKYGGLYIGDTSKKEIYLTFDEGYENGYTSKILDVLRDNNAKGVFFITGPYLKEHEDLVRRMVEEGHEVGNHTIHHPSLPEIGDKELEEEIVGLDRVFFEKFGTHMKYLRPPKGEYSERTLAITQKLGYCNMFWSFAYDDWYRDKVRGPQYAYNIVTRNLHNGAILLLHAVSKDNADGLQMIIQGAREQGYEIGNVNSIGK